MSTVEKDAQVLVKRSWKLPVVYVAASILLLVFGVSTYGDVTIRLNDKSQSYSIPDIVTSGAPIVWVLVALTILVTACAVIVTVRRIDVPSWARAVGMSVVGVSTILGFLLYAGSDSAGAVTLTSTLVSTVAISTPLIFGALSGVISERVGVVNIAIEGDLLVGAFAGIMAASYFQTAYAGLVAAPLAGALLGSLLALFSVKYGVDQIIIGVVLNVLALGLTTFLYGTIMKDAQDVLNTNRYSLPDIPIPGLVEIPVIGPVLSISRSSSTSCTRPSSRCRSSCSDLAGVCACGRAASTHARPTRSASTWRVLALPTRSWVLRCRSGWCVLTIGSGLAFTDNISAGNGYIALAAMILGKWNPLGAMSAAVMFGFAQAMARMLPNIEPSIPANLISMIPYVVTIVAVAGFVGKSRAPAAENIPYVK